MAWIFIATEIAVAVPIFMQSFWNIFILKKRNRPQLRLVTDDVPSVDVFITCCKEEVDLIIDTVRASCELDYPNDRFRVVVLDDGGCLELQHAVTQFQATYPNLFYRCREKIPGKPHHFKAGNLNYGLEEVCEMEGGASQYMAALDADMIPERHWLRAVLPHLLIDPKVALACPPQVLFTSTKRSNYANNPLSSSTMFQRAIRLRRVWISSFTSPNRSKML
jgi:cellulose synthase/poly-beta-1,6-N-acetylglucosamine synthase-like glycosyltransferase